MEDVSLGVIGNFAYFLLGLAAIGLWKRFVTRGQRRFWRPFLKGAGKLPVILTDKEGSSPRSPRKISITDVHAFSDVRSVLASLGRDVEIRARSQVDMALLTTECFVSLGGPLANGVSEQVLLRLGSRLPVHFNSAAKCFEFSGAQFCAEYDQNMFVVRDYGLIVRLRKIEPTDLTSKAAVVAFGLHGHGTQQSVRAIVTNSELGQQFKSLLADDLYAFLEFSFKDHKCTRSKILSVGKIH